jgi:chitinase
VGLTSAQNCNVTGPADVIVPNAPTETEVSVDIPFEVSWGSSAYNVYFEYVISNYPSNYISTITVTPNSITSDPNNNTTVIVKLKFKTPPLYALTYKFAIRYSCSANSANWNRVIIKGNTVLPPPTPTNLVASNISCAGGCKLTWNASTGASGYKIYKNGVYYAETNVNYYSVTGLNSSTNYTFTVSAVNVAGTSAQSTGAIITTLTRPPAPVLSVTFPTGSSYISLAWNTPSSNISSYTLYWSPSSGSVSFNNTLTSNSYRINGLVGTWRFSVIANSSPCPSLSSNIIAMSFPSIKSAFSNNYEVGQPESENIDIHISLVSEQLIVEGTMDFNAKVFDINGKKVIDEKNLSGSIDISKLTEGVYIVHINSAGNTVVRKFVKQQ